MTKDRANTKDLKDAGSIILVISLILKMCLDGVCQLHQILQPVWFTIARFIVVWFIPFNIILAQTPSVNTLDLYQPQALATCDFTAMDKGNFLWIYARINFELPVEDSLWVNYQWESAGYYYHDSVLFQSSDRRQMRLKWEFASDEIPPKITVNFTWKERPWLFQEHFPSEAIHPSGGIALWKSNIPWFEDWVHVNDSLQIENSTSATTIVYFYSHQFEPARAPMAMNPGAGSGALNIDTVFSILPGQYYTFESPGLYLFQSDSSTTEGRSILVTETNYPEPQGIEELAQPLRYITTRNEFLQLNKDLTDKQEFDKFWLSTLGSPQKARAAIKSFYQNVELANTLFTSYKEGWKTDRGMIITVLGAPLVVSKELYYETWTYKDVGGEEVYFNFKKVRNIFSNNHYELIRDKSYDRNWFQAIDRWREGRVY